MVTKKKALQAAAGNAGEALAIEDVFSTYLYTGNGTANTITNGIDLAGEGGMVWIKCRDTASDHTLFDTERGVSRKLDAKDTAGEVFVSTSYGVTGFNSDGFNLNLSYAYENTSSRTNVAWTWRKAPRFFDVVQYTGTGVARTIPHNLGVEPGCIIVKRVDSTSSWTVYHRGNNATAPEDYAIFLNATGAASTGSSWNYTAHTDTDFSVGTLSGVNSNGATYVAYLFAHDPLGPSGDGSDGLIACGSYTGNGSATGPVIDLGWEPQWVMIKGATSGAAYSWGMFDSMRGVTVGANDVYVEANTSTAEASPSEQLEFNASGFQLKTTGAARNASGQTYIYIAIRRGPMRQPTSGTEVFAPAIATNFGDVQNVGFVSDFFFMCSLSGGGYTSSSRHQGNKVLFDGINTSAEYTDGTKYLEWDANTDTFRQLWSSNRRIWHFSRAPGFFDAVAYTGTGASPQTHEHNLGVAPEMIIIKRRDSANDWIVYHSGNDVDGDGQPWTDYLRLDSTQAGADAAYFSDYQPTSVDFQAAGVGQTGSSGGKYIAYLFATLPGVSKVGSYTGNGSSQTIDCGFTSGARFILIKRTDSTGDWYFWDTVRGIVAANDPHLSLNTTAAQVTTDDSVDPDSSGFIVNQVAATNINVSSASYIFYAVA